jgi:hypothetical protein
MSKSRGSLHSFLSAQDPRKAGPGGSKAQVEPSFLGKFNLACISSGKKAVALTTLCSTRAKDIPRSESELQNLVDNARGSSDARKQGSNELRHLLTAIIGWEEALRKVKAELKKRTSEEKKWASAALEMAPAGLWWSTPANHRAVEA